MAPGFGADQGGLGAAGDLHGALAPEFFKIILVQGGIVTDTDKGIQLEDVAGQHRHLVPAAAVAGLHEPIKHHG